MSDQTEALEAFDAFRALTSIHQGVQCPNENCLDQIFSYDKGPSVACRCGLTWVSGGYQYLKYGVGAPFHFTDVRLVSQPISQSVEDEIQQGIAEEMHRTAEEEVPTPLLPEEAYELVQRAQAETQPGEVDDSLPVTDDIKLEPGDVIQGPVPADEIEGQSMN